MRQDPDFKIFVHSAGVNSGKRGSPQHVWLVYLEDTNERTIWTNGSKPPKVVDVSAARALHTGIRAAVDHLPDNCTAHLFSPQAQIVAIYGVSREVRQQQQRYKGPGGKPRPHGDLILDIDNVTEARGIILVGRAPEERHEYDMVDVTLKADTRSLWEGARGLADSDFG